VQQALVELESRGLTVQSIGLDSAFATPQESQSTGDRRAVSGPSTDDDIESRALRSHIATILEQSQRILPALEAYAQELPSGRQWRQMQSMCRVLASGSSERAAAALVESPEYWIPLLSAATSSSEPGQMLDSFLSESRRVDDIRQQWWLTLAYPVALACLAVLVMVALSIFVIPEFGKIFEEFDLELPKLTLLILALSRLLSSWRGLAVAAIVLGIVAVGLLLYRRWPVSRVGWWSDRLRLPFGRRSALARFSSFTAELIEAGIKIPDALRIAGYTVNHSRLQQAAWRMANELEVPGSRRNGGAPLPLTASVNHALSADLPDSTRVRLLRDISANHAERVRVGLSWTSGIVEPLGICLVGLVVGLVVIALFLPLVRLIHGLSG
jgi:type IV pilus assembly protein PilC